MEFSPTDLAAAAATADELLAEHVRAHAGDADRDRSVGQTITAMIRAQLKLPPEDALPYEMRTHINRGLRVARKNNAEEFDAIRKGITAAVERHYLRSQDSLQLQFTPVQASQHEADLHAIAARIDRTHALTAGERGRAVTALREGHKRPDLPLRQVFLDQEPEWASRRGDPLRALAHQCRNAAEQLTAEAEKAKAQLADLRSRAAEFERPENFRAAVGMLTTKIQDLTVKARSLLERAAQYTTQAAQELVSKAGELKARVQHQMSILRAAEGQIKAVEEATAEIEQRKQFEATAEEYGPIMNKAQLAAFYQDLADKIFDEVTATGESHSAEVAQFNITHGSVLDRHPDGRGPGDRAEALINRAVALAENGEQFPYSISDLIASPEDYEAYELAQSMNEHVDSPEQAKQVLKQMKETLGGTSTAGTGCGHVEQITTVFDNRLPENAATVNDLVAAAPAEPAMAAV